MRKLIILWNPCSAGLNVSSFKIGILNLVVFLVQIGALWDWRNQVENPFIVIVTKRRVLNTPIPPAGTLVRATLLTARVTKWNCKKYVGQLVREVAATNSAVNKKSLFLELLITLESFQLYIFKPPPPSWVSNFHKGKPANFFFLKWFPYDQQLLPHTVSVHPISYIYFSIY